MSKFHKTSYPGRSAFTAISSSHGRRNAHHPQHYPELTGVNKVEHPIERKIDIESSLLINHKNQPKKAIKTNDAVPRRTANRSEAKFYETSIGFSNARERPQSKQEARLKVNADGKIKT